VLPDARAARLLCQYSAASLELALAADVQM